VSPRLAVLAPFLLLVAGCVGLPDSGPVEVSEESSASASAAPFDFNPPGPVPGASQDQVVAGFLRAFQATPASTAAAAEFLTAEAASRWRPERRTIVYEGQRMEAGTVRVSVLLDGAFELDATGRWTGRLGDQRSSYEVEFRLAREGTEWRIAAPPDATIIPRSHFATRYREYSLYFFDTTGSVLLPEPVYLPWGPQAPTRLVAGLVAGAPPGNRAFERTSFPSSVRLGVGVPVGADGVAEVPLSAELLELDDRQLGLVFAQLSWTLRQVPEVGSVRLTVEGTPVELADGRQVVDVTGHVGFDPAIASASTELFGVRGRSVVAMDQGTAEAEVARLPRGGQPRSLGVSMDAQQFAVTLDEGSRTVVLPRDARTPAAEHPGTDLLRPMWDRTDRLWLVDRTVSGASVSVVTGRDRRALAAPGVDRATASAATLSRDGSRLVLAVRRGAGGTRLVVLRVVRDGEGAPVRLTRARPLATPQPLESVPALGWRDPTTVAVLTRPSTSTSEVELVSADGASASVGLSSSVEVLYDDGVGLATSPGRPSAVFVRTSEGRLHELEAQGQWDLDAVPGPLRAAAFVG
jgi:hypothetical protein